MKNKDDWIKKSGYHHQLIAALNTVSHLRRLAKEKDEKKPVQYYSDVNTKLSRTYPKTCFVTRSSEKVEAKAAGEKRSPGVLVAR